MKAKKTRNLRKRNAIAGYLFISPFIIGFLVFMLRPMIETFYMSLCRVNIVQNLTEGQKPFNFDFISNLKETNYYKALFSWTYQGATYKDALVNALTKMATQIPAILIFSFFVALLLNQDFKGRGFVRAVFFLPVILSSGVLINLETNNILMSGMKDIIAKSSGADITAALQDVLQASGVSARIMKPVFEIIDMVYDIALASGIQIVIFLSGLQTVSPSMYEAAKIEGCTAWESFWKITFPLVSSMILVNLVYSVVDFFMRLDNNYEVMNMVSTTLTNMDYGISAAMAWIYFIIVGVVLAILAAILSKVVYYYE